MFELKNCNKYWPNIHNNNLMKLVPDEGERANIEFHQNCQLVCRLSHRWLENVFRISSTEVAVAEEIQFLAESRSAEQW